MRKWAAVVQIHLPDDKLLYQTPSQGGALQQLLHLVCLSVNMQLKGQIQHRRRFCSFPVLPSVGSISVAETLSLDFRCTEPSEPPPAL